MTWFFDWLMLNGKILETSQ